MSALYLLMSHICLTILLQLHRLCGFECVEWVIFKGEWVKTEQGAKENIWTQEGGSGERLEKTAL
jgi:hypothetical protein